MSHIWIGWFVLMAWTLTDAGRPVQDNHMGGQTPLVLQKRQSFAGPVASDTTTCCVNRTSACDSGDWVTKCLFAVQEKSGDYKSVRVTFAMACLCEYAFDMYYLMLLIDGRPEYDVQIDPISQYFISQNFQEITPGFCNGATMDLTSWTFSNVDPGEYQPRLKPNPTECECSGLQCTAADGPKITVISNPCNSNPCDDHADCTPIEDTYNCSCQSGYIPIDGHCEEDPCLNEPCGPNGTCSVTEEAGSLLNYWCLCDEGYVEIEKTCVENPCYGNPCGPNGTCNITSIYTPADSKQILGYQCTCTQGYMVIEMDDGKTCVEDPCYGNPCGPNGTCTIYMPPDSNKQLEYRCTCTQGYQLSTADEDQTCVATDPTLTSAIIAAVVLGTLAGLTTAVVIILVTWLRSKKLVCPNHPDFLDDNTDIVHCTPNYNRTQKPTVLILYKPYYEFHKKVIRAFATFLQTRCQCEVLLDMFSTTIIIDAGAWVTDNLKNANKVIFIWSEEGQESSQILNNEDDMYSVGYKTMIESCRSCHNANKKWIVARMKYTPICALLETRPDCVPLYELHGEMTNLCSYLHDHDVDRLEFETELPSLPALLEGTLNEATDMGYGTALTLNQSMSDNSDMFMHAVIENRLMTVDQSNKKAEHSQYGNEETSENEQNRQASRNITKTNGYTILEEDNLQQDLWHVPQLQPHESSAVQPSPEQIPLIIQGDTQTIEQPSFVRSKGKKVISLDPQHSSVNHSSQPLIAHGIGSPAGAQSGQTENQNGQMYHYFPPPHMQDHSPAVLLMNLGQAGSSQSSDII
ncbi:uncharacterized protein [Amphiura filiformis]|uniref:uncharacterized protein n=1 Tax=Amphiura filiformis TaxID=82378 RepID=UPI003B212BB3